MLLKEDPRESLTTSDERRRKHGDRKRLGVLKKEKNRESKKRKVLKLEDDVSFFHSFVEHLAFIAAQALFVIV